MNKLNKLVTNYPVSLNEDEVANLSSTLLPVIEACGGGGGGITQYYGDGTYTEITGSHVITLTNETKQKINRTIPTKVSDLTDSANYQTTAEMADYETTQHANQTYLTKSSADNDYAPLSTTADVEALKAVSGDFSLYYPKTQTSSDSELATEFAKYASKSDIEAVSGNLNTLSSDVNTKYVTNRSLEETLNGYATTTYVTQQIANKQNKLTFGYDENNAISSIDGTALAGNGGKTYSAGQYINIDSNDTISVTGLMALDEYAQYEPVLIGDSNITAISSKEGTHTQWNLAINSTPVVTDTKLVGENSITAHTTNVSGEWLVGLEQTAHNAIASIEGISTDVGTLKTASANWNKVSDKLDTTAFSTVSGNFLTAHQSLEDYATKSDINGMATQSWVGEQGFYTKASGDNDYAPKSITATVNTLTAASARWDEVSAKLGTAQYANDSATFVTKPDTTQTELNNNYLIYSTLTGPGTTTGWMPLSSNYYSKTEADGRYAKASAALTSVSANTPLSGNGTTANPLGFDLTNAYTIDGTNGITTVPNSTTNKVVVQMTNDVWTDTQVVHSSISAWNEVSGLSAKSTVSANTATNVISVSANSTATTANISATTYYTNTADSNLVAQRLFVVHNDNDLVAHVQAGLCQGQGSLFFVMSGFNS